MKSQEELLDLIKKRTMERIVFTRNLEPFQVSVEELPPFIPDTMRAKIVVNSEVEKNSALLDSPSINGMVNSLRITFRLVGSICYSLQSTGAILYTRLSNYMTLFALMIFKTGFCKLFP